MTDLSSLIDLTNKIFFKVMYQFPGTGFSETDSFHFLPLRCMVMDPNPRDARSASHTKRLCIGTPVIISGHSQHQKLSRRKNNP